MKISDTVVGAGFVMAGAAIFAATANYPLLDEGHPGPSLFPRIVAVLMAGFGAVLSAQGVRGRDASEVIAWRQLHRSSGFVNALFVLAGVLAFILLVDRAGFLVMSTFVLSILMWRLRVRLLWAVPISGLFTVLMYALFAKLLRVPLPLGLLWW
ncbi:MAG: tripartite tricarboxylate transporter TctB family protein [Candidatus Rokubacteria bacterium]|nr:tripartite tricarboxylate transporter TctB family protein [Candidatus Rokubacteria bacterium]